MEKWYDDPILDRGVIISSRVRLARNIKKYPFTLVQDNESAANVIADVLESLKRPGDLYFEQFDYSFMNEMPDIEKTALLNTHAISPQFARSGGIKGLFLEHGEKISIMINEEDHIRMQAICPGDNMDAAWEAVNKTDDLIEESVEYAFDKEFGYLTSCPTNTGTGLRASYMIHIPLIEGTGDFGEIQAAIGKFGMTVRGIYGEGTESMGGIYQISNQVTMGKSEEEIINSLKGITSQIIDSEHLLREKMLNHANIEVCDRVYRAYGILSNCRRISLKEAIRLLSDIRFGYVSGILTEKRPNLNTYAIMINIQNGMLERACGKDLREADADIARADFIRKNFL